MSGKLKLVILAPANVVHTQRWVEALHARGVQIVLVSQHSCGPWQPPVGVRLATLRHEGTKGYFLNVPELRRILRTERPALLNVHYATGYGTSAMLSGFHPRVLSVWGSDVFDFPDISPLHRRLVVASLRSADVVASTSHSMARQVGRVLMSRPLREPIAITPFGVDTARFTPRPSLEPKVDLALTIGTVKKLERKYGVDTLVKAFALLQPPATGAPPLLRLVGEGAQQSKLQALVVDLGLAARVQFVGAVAHAQVPEQLRGFDIFVAASRLDSESFGVAVIEASACGLPVVVSDAGGLPEVVRDGETGLVVQREDPVALARALQQLLDDPALRVRLGRAGRVHVQAHYEWDACVQQMVELYERVAHSAAMNRGGGV